MQRRFIHLTGHIPFVGEAAGCRWLLVGQVQLLNACNARIRLVHPAHASPEPRGWLLRAFEAIPRVPIVLRSDAGMPEDGVQGVNTAVLSPVLFNYLAKAVVPAAHGCIVWGFGQWHEGVLVYHYRVDFHHQGAPVKNPEDLPSRTMRSR